MPTRYNTKSRENLGIRPLQSGYESDGKDLPDISIPSCGIEDVDVAMFNLFDKEIKPECGGIEDAPLTKVPVVFAAGEKWALLKRGSPLRDRNGTLIIPLITIVRTGVTQDTSSDVVGRGINQQVGEIVVRRKLDKSDRDYQNLINKLFIRNQGNLAVPASSPTSQAERLTTANPIGRLDGSSDLLSQNLRDNVIETIVVPTPQFYTAKYQVTVWTQYMQHSNQIVEKLFSSFLPQGQSWRLDTQKGYWFVATPDGGSYSMETNFDDMSQQERFIKYTFDVSVPAYFFANRSPGSPIPIKRYISYPQIKFEIDVNKPTTDQYVIGSDDPTLPLDEKRNIRDDQRTPGWRQQKIYPIDEQDTNDPAIEPRRGPPRSVRELKTSTMGETIYVGSSLGALEIVITDD